jgi:5-(carboxyamino)imidazole ribonucleotide synthase
LYPGILKRARFGYDGKGQMRIANVREAVSAFHKMGGEACVLEKRVALALEVSVVVARGSDGRSVAFPIAENQHVDGILDVSIVPARVTPELAREAEKRALGVAEQLQYVGVLAVEFFVLTDGKLVANEIAPRPHNSGHYTLDACVTSQFEQQARAMCGLPFGSTRLLAPVVMINLLGDLWANGVPPWERVFECSDARLHLYGKHEARSGRKMGHFTTLAATPDAALALALAIRAQLQPKPQARAAASA